MTKIIPILSIILVAIIIILISMWSWVGPLTSKPPISGKSISDNVISSYCGDGTCNNGEKCSTCRSDCPASTETYPEQESYPDQECHSVPYTDTICEPQDLTYTLDTGACNYRCDNSIEVCKKTILSICYEWQTVCLEATAIYSIAVTNLDTSYGIWQFKSKFTIDGKQYEGTSYSHGIYPQKTENFYFSYSWTGTELDPADRQDLDYCSYLTAYVPTKEICRDVLKTRQECTSITKYRTVTKTKEVCN